MKQFVEQRIEAGDYSSASEYVRELLRADQKRQAREELENVLLNSLKSGDPIEVTPAMIEDVRQRLRARSAQRKAGR